MFLLNSCVGIKCGLALLVDYGAQLILEFSSSIIRATQISLSCVISLFLLKANLSYFEGVSLLSTKQLNKCKCVSLHIPSIFAPR